MQKKKIFKIEDSNVEGIGTEADKECRATAAATEKAWKKVKKKAGLWAWRIEKFKVKVNREALQGQFFNDDSYIVLKSKVDPTTDKLTWDVHFWLGQTTSQDEAGTAAYKTVELDDFLGGDPIQHREVSGHESKMFLSYFPNNMITILDGGIESGFNHVEPESFTPKLLWLKGKKNVRVVQVPIELASLNSGDVFVLDAGLLLYQYQGRACGKDERLKAAILTRSIDDERKGKPDLLVFSQADDPAADDSMGLFFSYFQDDLKKDTSIDIKEGTEVPAPKVVEMLAEITDSKGQDDAAWEKDSNVSLWSLSDASGSMVFTEEAKAPVSKSLLRSEDVFIFDIGCEIFVWIGSGASAGEKAAGMKNATQYMIDNDRPNFLPVTQILEGGENEMFDAAFA